MNKIIILILMITALLYSLSCRDEKLGGSCQYTNIVGQAEIIEIDTLNLKFYINFMPDDGEAVYRYPNCPDTNMQAFICDARNDTVWFNAWDIRVGSVHECLRREIITGTCSPVVFEINDVGCNGI